jgi:hypothetical protein
VSCIETRIKGIDPEQREVMSPKAALTNNRKISNCVKEFVSVP